MKETTTIKDLLKLKESQQLEFKASFNKIEAGKIICSFLNNDGGQLVIGVDDSRNVIGLTNAETVEKDLRRFLVKEIIPEPAVSISVERLANKQFLLVKVWGGGQKPYIFKGTIFYRRNTVTVQATSREVAALIHDRQRDEQRWERQIAPGAGIRQLDTKHIYHTMEVAKKRGRTSQDFKSISDFLNYFGLVRNGNITNAALILFGREPSRFIPQSKIRLAVFPDSKTSSEFIYDRFFEGSLMSNIFQIREFFDVNFGISSKFKRSTWLRADKKNYPDMALREAVLNALIHRDYSNPSGTVLIAFYPDRLEISNYGGLPKEITPDKLKHSHLSLPVNPDIAQICFLRGMIEKIGRGTIKILEECRERGLKEPFWQVKSNTTTITFPGLTIPSAQNAGLKKGLSDGLTKVLNDGLSDGLNDGLIKGVSDGVKKELFKLLNLISNNPGLITDELVKSVRKTKPTVERYIKILRNINLVEFKGHSKTGGYDLTDSTKRKLQKLG